MPRWNGDDAPAPLPRHWLPKPVPREDMAEWEDAVARVLAASGPELSERRPRELRPDPTWPALLGSWWKPAAALAAAAAVATLLVGREPARPNASALPLSVVATQGDPALLLAGLGVEADPVLSLIALQGVTR